MKSSSRLLLTKPVAAENVPVVQPIYQTTLFRMPSYDAAVGAEHATRPSSYYTRWGNPTVSFLEKQLASLAETETAIGFPSGMSAITTVLLALNDPGDTLAVSTRIYGDSSRFCAEEMRRFGYEVRFFVPEDTAQLEDLLRRGCRSVYFETLSNPELILPDCKQICRLASRYGATSICDATFTPPGVLETSTLGADVVVHSLTKYLSGHFAVHGGAAMCSDALAEKIWRKQTLYGSCMDPHAAWLVSEGLKTIHVRVAQQNASAARIAEFLEMHPRVTSVRYPRLRSHPQHDRARELLDGGGGVISFSVAGPASNIARLLEAPRLIGLSVSLGGIYSVIEHAQSMSHSMVQEAGGEASGGSRPADDLFRLSVGLEDADDLIADLAQALATLS
ncbi:trans-sulfuration enzyme family protein [Sorangium sp. So ce542]|uniref:trans-sulfuration enzyme family protein n=1 Tax=Sorangium sp. So ce542 TaxID=3133316 RepID=UPI003F6277BB